LGISGLVATGIVAAFTDALLAKYAVIADLLAQYKSAPITHEGEAHRKYDLPDMSRNQLSWLLSLIAQRRRFIICGTKTSVARKVCLR